MNVIFTVKRYFSRLKVNFIGLNRIRLEVIKSSTIPLSNVEGQETGLDPQYNEREELEFSWNEKIFSPREFDQYRDERNCKTPLESEYHHRILKLISDGVTSTSNRLFTYISKDRVPNDVSVIIISVCKLKPTFFLHNFSN